CTGKRVVLFDSVARRHVGFLSCPERLLARRDGVVALLDRAVAKLNRAIAFLAGLVARADSVGRTRLPLRRQRLGMPGGGRLQALDVRAERGDARTLTLQVARQLGSTAPMRRDLVVRSLRRRSQLLQLLRPRSSVVPLLLERGIQRLDLMAQPREP